MGGFVSSNTTRSQVTIATQPPVTAHLGSSNVGASSSSARTARNQTASFDPATGVVIGGEACSASATAATGNRELLAGGEVSSVGVGAIDESLAYPQASRGCAGSAHASVPHSALPVPSLHVNSRIIPDDLVDVQAEEVEDAEEEAMQRAIEASLETQRNRAAAERDVEESRLVPLYEAGGMCDSVRERTDGHLTGDKRLRGDADTPRSNGGSKVTTAGLGGSAWVDNSDFHALRGVQQAAGDAGTRSRSEGFRHNSATRTGGACDRGTGTAPVSGPGVRSGIVSLPRIQPPVLPAEQREMVKDLHDSISMTIGGPGGQGGGARGGAPPDMRALMEESFGFSLTDLAIDRPCGRNSDARFNERFHSCRKNHNSGSPRLSAPGMPSGFSSVTPVVDSAGGPPDNFL